MSILRTVIIMSILSATVTARAELKFEQKEIELHPTATDAEVVAHFKYENTGEKPVKITAVQSSCGCTAATAGKNEVGPGEKGEITATFKIGDRFGPQKKNVTVTTDDAANPTTILTLAANVPRVLEINPTFLFWNENEPKEPKTITIKAPPDSPVKEVTAVSSSPDFTATVERGETPKEFRLKVQPKGTASMMTATVTITPDVPTNPPKAFYISARVLKTGGTFSVPSGSSKPAAASSATASPGKILK